MQIDFEKLLKDYNSELVTKLRGFNDQIDYLQYWVPDFNKTTSLLNLVDALYEAGKLNFSILILKVDKKLINQIKKISKKIGNIEIKKENKNYKIIFSINRLKYKNYREKKTSVKSKKFTKKAKSSYVKELINKKKNYNILSTYEQNLVKHKLKNNINQRINDEGLFSEFINNKNKLFINVEKNTNLILNCWHDFVLHNNDSIMIDKFCDIILNKHIQEAVEHGTIYLEHELRPNDIKKKIRGIILPKQAGGFFFNLDRCIKKIYTKVKKKYNFKDTINKEYSGLSEGWLRLSYDQKKDKIKKILFETIIPSLKLNKEDITFHKIEFDTRIVVKISNELEKQNCGEINYMIEIENFFKNYIDKRLELFVTEKKDDNVLRIPNSPQRI